MYAEPRGSDARQPSAKYAVIWMPRATYQDVLLRKQSHAEAISIARVGSRFGLRCNVADAQTLHGKVRPDAPFVSRAGTKLYHTGPWPFGAQRSNLLRTFKAIHWPAQPLQPVPGPHAGSTGIWWVVQAEAPPPTPVLTTTQGEVLVVEQKEKELPSVARPPLVASKAALQRFQAKAVDPGVGTFDYLQVQDPWRHYLDARGAAQAAAHSQASPANALQARGTGSSGQSISQADLSALAKRLEESVSVQISGHVAKVNQEVSDKLSKAQAEFDSRLEQVHHVASRLEESSTLFGQSQSSQVPRQVEARFEQVEAQMTALHARVDSQESSLQQAIQGLFQAQTQRLEELLGSKRARSDCQ